MGEWCIAIQSYPFQALDVLMSQKCENNKGAQLIKKSVKVRRFITKYNRALLVLHYVLYSYVTHGRCANVRCMRVKQNNFQHKRRLFWEMRDDYQLCRQSPLRACPYLYHMALRPSQHVDAMLS